MSLASGDAICGSVARYHLLTKRLVRRHAVKSVEHAVTSFAELRQRRHRPEGLLCGDVPRRASCGDVSARPRRGERR